MNRPEFDDLMAERRKRGIYPHESDSKFFAKPTKSWIVPRKYHVRRALVTDDFDFHAGNEDPKNFITIVSRDNSIHIVLPLDEANMGGFVNSDQYAMFRMELADKQLGSVVSRDRAIWEADR